MRSVALVYQPAVAEARGLAESCAAVVESLGFLPVFVSAWELSRATERSGVFLAVTFGGDGTIIKAARWLAGTNVPILGIAMGKLGFMTELQPDAACEGLRIVLRGGFWIDERTMLAARIESVSGTTGIDTHLAMGGDEDSEPLIALNEVAVTRGASARVLQIEVEVDETPLVRYVADGVIVATPTGSTAYALAAGGPVVAPSVNALLVVPVAAHLAVLRSIVLPSQSKVALRVSADHPAMLVLDGQRQISLDGEHRVLVESAPERTLFARMGKPSRFYDTLVPNMKKR